MSDEQEELPPNTAFQFGRQIYHVGHCEAKGKRSTMEDALVVVGDAAGSGSSFFAIYDGHGGSEVSIYAANNLHRIIAQNYSSDCNVKNVIQEAIDEVNEFCIKKFPEAGCTAAIVFIDHNMIYAANVGDSRSVLLDHHGNIKRLSYDHKASDPDEQEYVTQRGGKVIQGRTGGILELSRSIGDGCIKPYVSCEAYQTQTRRKDNQYLVIGCDGVFDVLTDEQVVRIASQALSPTAAAHQIVETALKKGSTDNCSCIVAWLTPK